MRIMRFIPTTKNLGYTPQQLTPKPKEENNPPKGSMQPKPIQNPPQDLEPAIDVSDANSIPAIWKQIITNNIKAPMFWERTITNNINKPNSFSE